MRKITIVMAVYKPNIKWLIEELDSIYDQTYRDFEVLAWNDCPQDTTNYTELFKEHLKEIPFKIYKGKENLGSNGAFQNLTELSNTEYIAYCDQDDIWMPDKLQILLDLLDAKDNNTLAFSDMMIINGKSEIIADQVAKVRPRQIFYPGKNALLHLLTKNFVTGCTMMMKSDIAKAAIPFPSSVFHDWWLAICAACKGEIVMADKPLMKYRIYGGNQSGVLKGITNKSSYYEKRILAQMKLVDHVWEAFGPNDTIKLARDWNHARANYFEHPSIKYLKVLMKLRKYSKSTVLFEAVLPFIPTIVLKRIVEEVQKGNL
ncbi:glycosyltransferase [uncultured Megasphaera sp.]|uniref:glycosyltransferase n=1 Tax=uncultured Megasphaera sp. TaxID=165188 RepID=UPI0025FF96A2|nr:glycosyltransferase [uncultured Megasphaera sp.]